MTYKAMISFSGLISMAEGEVREISDSSLADDLLKCGYIIEAEKKEEKKSTKRKGKKNEDKSK